MTFAIENERADARRWSGLAAWMAGELDEYLERQRTGGLNLPRGIVQVAIAFLRGVLSGVGPERVNAASDLTEDGSELTIALDVMSRLPAADTLNFSGVQQAVETYIAALTTIEQGGDIRGISNATFEGLRDFFAELYHQGEVSRYAALNPE